MDNFNLAINFNHQVSEFWSLENFITYKTRNGSLFELNTETLNSLKLGDQIDIGISSN